MCLVFTFFGLGVSNTVEPGAGLEAGSGDGFGADLGAGSGTGCGAGLGVGSGFGIFSGYLLEIFWFYSYLEFFLFH